MLGSLGARPQPRILASAARTYLGYQTHAAVAGMLTAELPLELAAADPDAAADVACLAWSWWSGGSGARGREGVAVGVGTGASSASPAVEAEAAKAEQSAISVAVNRMVEVLKGIVGGDSRSERRRGPTVWVLPVPPQSVRADRRALVVGRCVRR